MSAVRPGDFVGAALSAEPARFTYQLDAATRDSLARLLDAGSASEPGLGAKARELLADATRASMQTLAHGRGFILVRGLPIIDRPLADVHQIARYEGKAI